MLSTWIGVALAAEAERVSLDASGAPGSPGSACPAISADGQVIAFLSSADDLVPGDTNGAADVFVRDRVAQTTTRVSVASGGGQGSGASFCPALSADGRVVAFASAADDLVTGDHNAATDVFVHDRTTAITEGLSLAGSGDSKGPSVSADGSVVAFQSQADDLVVGDDNGVEDVFVWDRRRGDLRRISIGSIAPSTSGRVSGDGRSVAFVSRSPLDPSDDNDQLDVYLRDLDRGTTERISPAGPSSWPAIAHDGSVVAFQSSAPLAPADVDEDRDVYLVQRGGPPILASPQRGTASQSPALSSDGGWVAFVSGDQIWTHRPTRPATAQVADRVAPSGIALSADGAWVAFQQDGEVFVAPTDLRLGAAFEHAVPMQCPGTTVWVRNADRSAVRLVVDALDRPLDPGEGIVVDCDDAAEDWLVLASPGPLDVVASTPQGPLVIPARSLGSDVSVSVRLSSHPLAPDGPIAVSVSAVVTNAGPRIARDITLRQGVDLDDTGADLALGLLPPGSEQTDGAVILPVGDLWPGSSTEVTIWAVAIPSRPTWLTAEAIATAAGLERSPGDNRSVARLAIGSPP